MRSRLLLVQAAALCIAAALSGCALGMQPPSAQPSGTQQAAGSPLASGAAPAPAAGTSQTPNLPGASQPAAGSQQAAKSPQAPTAPQAPVAPHVPGASGGAGTTKLSGFPPSSSSQQSAAARQPVQTPASPQAPALVQTPLVPQSPSSALRKAGLYNNDGSPHALPVPNPVTGTLINVVDFGADPEDNGNDDRPAIQKALDAARPGDEVYFPDGVYNLKSTHPANKNTHLQLKAKVNVRGESRDAVILKSDYNNRQKDSVTASGSNASVMEASSAGDIVISSLTVSSSWNGTYPTDHKNNNPTKGGPRVGINIDKASSGIVPSNIVVREVTVEKFERIGVRISRARDVTVDGSTFRLATDMGGGGAGYGVAILGAATAHLTAEDKDSSYNVIQNNVFDGSVSLRHGALLGYATHNNAVRSNRFVKTRIDSIDLHGDYESWNEIYDNTITGTQKGAGIGVGNTGGTPPNNHSFSGPSNYIHDNTIRNAMDGIVVIMGTPSTLIERNTIEADEPEADSPPFRNGITIKHAVGTVVKDNTVRNATGSKSVGIWLAHDSGDAGNNRLGEGDPQSTVITGNKLIGHDEPIRTDAGTGTVAVNNVTTP